MGAAVREMSKGLRERWGHLPATDDWDHSTRYMPYARESAADYRRQMLDGADRSMPAKSLPSQQPDLFGGIASKNCVKAVHDRSQSEEEATRQARILEEDISQSIIDQGHVDQTVAALLRDQNSTFGSQSRVTWSSATEEQKRACCVALLKDSNWRPVQQEHCGQFEHEENSLWFRGLQEKNSIYTDSAKDYRTRMLRGESPQQSERPCGTSSEWTKLRSQNNRLDKELKQEQRPKERPIKDDAVQKPVVPTYELASSRLVAQWSAREVKPKQTNSVVSDEVSDRGYISTNISKKAQLPDSYWGYGVPSGYEEVVHTKVDSGKPPEKINSFVELMKQIKSNAAKHESDRASVTQENKFGKSWGKIKHIVEPPAPE